MIELQVRCCCNAGKLLGFLPVHDSLVQLDRRFTLRLKPILSDSVEAAMGLARAAPSMTADSEAITLSIGQVYANNSEYKLAIKSNDYPMETLHRLIGFREPTSEEMDAHYDSLGIPASALIRRQLRRVP